MPTNPNRTIGYLNKRKLMLIADPNATAYDWIRLGDEYALIDASRQVDFCLMQADRLKSRTDPDERSEDEQE